MSHAVCLEQYEHPSIDAVCNLIDQAMAQANLRRHNDYISRVFLFCTPHFAHLFADLAHQCFSKTNCMNVWGGCVAGLVGNRQVLGERPAAMVAVFGKAFEVTPQQGTPAQANIETLNLVLAEQDHDLTQRWEESPYEPDSAQVPANTIGLLSYGANYAKMPRVENSRLSSGPESCMQLRTHQSLVLNSEGLEFLGKAATVTQANGLFLIKADGIQAATALHCPGEQTRPVGLRLQLIHEQGESWVPVMDILPDGTLGLAAPVLNGQRVRLARRKHNAMAQEIEHWLPMINTHFEPRKYPKLGFVVAGFERSTLCHLDEQDIQTLMQTLPDTALFGILGQAAWLGNQQVVLTPPRNNRLSLCLFNPPT